MNTDSALPIDVQLLTLTRSIVAEKRTGLRVMSAKVLVVHEFGQFELQLQVDRWSKDSSEVQAILHEQLVAFGKRLAALQPGDVRVPQLPSPQTK